MAKRGIGGTVLAAVWAMLAPADVSAQGQADAIPLARTGQPGMAQRQWPTYGPNAIGEAPAAPPGAGVPHPAAGHGPHLPQPIGFVPAEEDCCDMGPLEQFFCEAPDVWASFEYMRVQIRDMPLDKPLLTTRTNLTSVGALDEESTRVLFGNQDLDLDILIGGKATIGLGCLEASYFFVEAERQRFPFVSDQRGVPLLSRPVFATQLGEEVVFAVSFPTVAEGGAVISATSEFSGAELNYFTPLIEGIWRTNMFIGFRYLFLDESFSIEHTVRPLFGNTVIFEGLPFPPGNQVFVSDKYETRNHIYAAQIGLRSEYFERGVFVNAEGKIAFGANQQRTDLRGTSTLIREDESFVIVPGGVLIIPSHNGNHKLNNEFAVIPEFSASIGVEVCEGVRVYVGYTGMYLAGVLRPTSQIARAIDTRMIPTDFDFDGRNTVVRPLLRETNFWMHGLHFGFAIHF